MSRRTSQKERPTEERPNADDRNGRGRVDPVEGVAGEKPGTVRPPGGPTKAVSPPRNLYELCARLAVDKTVEDPLDAIRQKLILAMYLLAPRRGEDPRAWSVYVERHIVGVRFILRDAAGREVDLQAIPAAAIESVPV